MQDMALRVEGELGARWSHSAKALGLVEHDMDAVFRIADCIKVRIAYLGEHWHADHSPLIVDARGIHAWYGSSHVLQGAALQIARGQTVGLLGRSGMGKSTLMTHPELIVDRDYRRVLAHADQAPVLQKGQGVLQGTADDVAGSAALAAYLGIWGVLRNSSEGNVALALVEYAYRAINSGVNGTPNPRHTLPHAYLNFLSVIAATSPMLIHHGERSNIANREFFGHLQLHRPISSSQTIAEPPCTWLWMRHNQGLAPYLVRCGAPFQDVCLRNLCVGPYECLQHDMETPCYTQDDKYIGGANPNGPEYCLLS